MEQIQKLVKDLEKVKIENKELQSLKKVRKTNMKKTPGDFYDFEDVEEFDSETELLKGKQSGFKRTGPQVQASEVFKCSECNYQLPNKKSLEEHMKRHQDLKIRCRSCGETFKNDKDLEFHKTYEHRKQTQLNCMQCDFQTNNKSLLRNHINLQHTKEQDRDLFECDQCEMEVSSTWHLRNNTRDVQGPQEVC